MNTIVYLLPPLIASIFGVLVILFSKNISVFLQVFWERVPKYDKTMFKDLSVKPFYIVTLGVVYTFVAIMSLVERLKSIM